MGHVDHFNDMTVSIDRAHLAPQGLRASLDVLLVSILLAIFYSLSKPPISRQNCVSVPDELLEFWIDSSQPTNASPSKRQRAID